MAVAPATTRPMSERSATDGLVRFVVLAYVIAWAWSVPMAIAGDTVEQGNGWPTHVPSLLAPALAAIVICRSEGRSSVVDLLRRIARWRFGLAWWLVVVSPMLILGVTIAGMSVAGRQLPDWDDFAAFNGLPSSGVLSTFLLVFDLNGVGEEAGWRGFLQDRLQRRFDPLPATLIVAGVWAIWHAPFFFILSTYAGFNAMTLVMFPLGLASGAIVLTWLYNHTGRSILAAALWHTFYNMAVATGGATDMIQAAVTAVVMAAAVVLVCVEIALRRRGRDSILGRPSR